MLACASISIGGHLISTKMIKTYSGLNTKDKSHWVLSISRSAMALYFACVSVQTLLLNPDLTADPCFATNNFSVTNMTIAASFFLWETLTLLYLYIFHGVREAPLMLHHLLGLLFYSSSWVSGKMQTFGLIALMEEISAPFTALGWMFKKTGYDNTKQYVANHISLLVVWLFLRIGWDFIIGYYMITNAGFIFETINPLKNSLLDSFTTFIMLLGNCILVLFLNPYWFYKKYMQLVSTIKKLKNNQSTKKVY